LPFRPDGHADVVVDVRGVGGDVGAETIAKDVSGTFALAESGHPARKQRESIG
jgi:hypothetical protein